MLILSRKCGEKVTIDGGIEIAFLGIRGGQVKVGFTAPADTKIYRNEILEKIKATNKQCHYHDDDVIDNCAQKKVFVENTLSFQYARNHGLI